MSSRAPISAGDYVVEPPDLWTERLSREKWGDQIPHVARQPDGNERWVVGGKLADETCLVRAGALRDDRHDEPQRWSDVPTAAYDPRERAAAMERDGVSVQVLYPGALGYGAEALASIRDPALEVACCRAYNDWLLETWGADPHFVPQCVLPFSSIEAARAELERAVAKGHRGAVMHPYPWHLRPELPHLHLPDWDPLWATAQESGVPICWDAGAGERFMLDIYPGFDTATRNAFDSVRRPVSNAVAAASFLLGGIAERFDELKLVFASSSVDWIVFQLENSDWEWHQSQLHKENIPLPSEVFRRQCYVTTWFDRAGLQRAPAKIGTGNILWQSVFPRSTSTYPESAKRIEDNLAGLSDAAREKILWRNAAELYGL